MPQITTWPPSEADIALYRHVLGDAGGKPRFPCYHALMKKVVGKQSKAPGRLKNFYIRYVKGNGKPKGCAACTSLPPTTPYQMESCGKS